MRKLKVIRRVHLPHKIHPGSGEQSYLFHSSSSSPYSPAIYSPSHIQPILPQTLDFAINLDKEVTYISQLTHSEILGMWEETGA